MGPMPIGTVSAKQVGTLLADQDTGAHTESQFLAPRPCGCEALRVTDCRLPSRKCSSAQAVFRATTSTQESQNSLIRLPLP